ncbi:MAG: hypothetical protein F4X99_18230 [Gammaproteobacteria bacterium]|nr:hypothetical protein [Gammaproteobacteria bacterium]
MQELFNDPRSYLALAGLVFAIGRWVGEAKSDRKAFKESMAEILEEPVVQEQIAMLARMFDLQQQRGRLGPEE